MLKSYLIYFQISRTSTLRKHSATNCGASLLITVDEFEPNLESPPMKLITVDDRRYGYCNVKTTNLLPAVLSSTRAEQSDCDEAIFVKDGYITECTKSNISIIKQGRLITHPNSTNILPGITRRHLLRVCDNIGLKFIEQPFTKEEVFLADEVLITSSTKLLRAASHIDNIPVGRRADDILQAIRQDLNSDYYLYVK
jgi:D-alanine transaminase